MHDEEKKREQISARSGNINSSHLDFLCGKEGFVWATYEPRQSEVIRATLLVQNIHSEIQRRTVTGQDMLLLRVTNKLDIADAIDFIWRGKTGLRLRPDWNYGPGQSNESFERWLTGHPC